MRKFKIIPVVLAALLVVFITGQAIAESPEAKIPYQKAWNGPQTSQQDFWFSLWDAPQGGKEVWFEYKTLNATSSPIKTILGDVIPLKASFFDQQLWVQVAWKTGLGNWLQLGNREQLYAVPYAMHSETAVQSESAAHSETATGNGSWREQLDVGCGDFDILSYQVTVNVASSIFVTSSAQFQPYAVPPGHDPLNEGVIYVRLFDSSNKLVARTAAWTAALAPIYVPGAHLTDAGILFAVDAENNTLHSVFVAAPGTYTLLLSGAAGGDCNSRAVVQKSVLSHILVRAAN